MSGLRSRDKGKRYERRVASMYQDRGYEAKRGYQSRGGNEMPDVDVPNLPIRIEAKSYAKIGLAGRAYEQAAADTKASTEPAAYPVVHLHADRGPDLVVISAELWFLLLSSWMTIAEPFEKRSESQCEIS